MGLAASTSSHPTARAMAARTCWTPDSTLNLVGDVPAPSLGLQAGSSVSCCDRSGCLPRDFHLTDRRQLVGRTEGQKV